MKSFSLAAGALAVSAVGSFAQAAPPPPNVFHVRGTVQSFNGTLLTVATAKGPVRVTITPPLGVVSVMPSDRAHIKNGSFLGIASVPGANRTQRALEVVVFPESGRGTGEGSYGWDLADGGSSRVTNGTAMHSRMTNGTVSKGAGGTTLTLQYKNGTGMGTQTLTLPPNIPVVTFGPGQPALLKPGAHVFVAGVRQPDGSYKANRVLVGKGGLTPPM